MPAKITEKRSSIRQSQILEKPNVKSNLTEEQIDFLDRDLITKGCGNPCDLEVPGINGDLFLDKDTKTLYGYGVKPSCCTEISDVNYDSSYSNIIEFTLDLGYNYMLVKSSKFFTEDINPERNPNYVKYTYDFSGIYEHIPSGTFFYIKHNSVNNFYMLWFEISLPYEYRINPTFTRSLGSGPLELNLGSYTGYIINGIRDLVDVKTFLETKTIIRDESYYIDINNIKVPVKLESISDLSGYYERIVKLIGKNNLELDFIQPYIAFSEYLIYLNLYADDGSSINFVVDSYNYGIYEDSIVYPVTSELYSCAGCVFKILSYNVLTQKCKVLILSGDPSLLPSGAGPGNILTLEGTSGPTTMKYTSFSLIEVDTPDDILTETGVVVPLQYKDDGYIYHFDWDTLTDQFNIQFCSVEVDVTDLFDYHDYHDYHNYHYLSYLDYVDNIEIHTKTEDGDWEFLVNLGDYITADTDTTVTIPLSNENLTCGENYTYFKIVLTEDIEFDYNEIVFKNLTYAYLDSDCCWEPIVIGNDTPTWHKRFDLTTYEDYCGPIGLPPAYVDFCEWYIPGGTDKIADSSLRLPYNGIYQVHIFAYTVIDEVSESGTWLNYDGPATLQIQSGANGTYRTIDVTPSMALTGLTTVNHFYCWSVQGSVHVEMDEADIADRYFVIKLYNNNGDKRDFGGQDGNGWKSYVHVEYLGETEGDCISII